jgi:hypothetical protein
MLRCHVRATAVSPLGQRLRAALPAVMLLVGACAVLLFAAVGVGFAPTPPIFQIVLALAVAALVGVAVTDQVRAALRAWRGTTAAEMGIHRRGRRERMPDDPDPDPDDDRQPRPGWIRIALVAVGALVLAGAVWVHPGPFGAAVLSGFRFFFGYGAQILPVLPLAFLMPRSRLPRPDWPKDLPLVPATARRLWTGEEARTLVVASLRWLRERVFARTTGIVLATLGLLQVVRGNPRVGDGGTRRAGGLVGFLVAEPLRLVFGAAGAIGLLGAALVCAAVVIAAAVGRRAGTVVGYGALAAALGLPLAAVATLHWVGYDYYLTVAGTRVVVGAGLSSRHREATFDAGLATDGLSPTLKSLFAAGLPVQSPSDGTRIAKALAQPGTESAATFASDDFHVKVGDCFDFIGGSSQLRYVAPCNGNHVGEVFYVGHLPFTVDPGTKQATDAARAMCEQSYGGYLGVPFGQSYLPLEAPLTPKGFDKGVWAAKPVVACWLGAVGPWPLKGAKTIAALQQKVPWSPSNGCAVALPDSLRVTAQGTNARCLAPGPGEKLSIPGASFSIDLEFGSIGKTVGNARIGAACAAGPTLDDGYSFEVIPDGTIEIWKRLGGQATKLGASAKPKGVAGPATGPTAMQVSCRVLPGQGVELVANSTGGRKVSAMDATSPLTALSPRLLFMTGAVAPAQLNVVIFSATRL